MSGEKYDNFSHLFNDAQKEIKDLVRKRNQLNIKIKNYISSFQMIEYEIYKTLFDTREHYNKKRQYCAKKIKKLRRRAIEFQELLDYLINDKKNLQKPKLYSNSLHLINSIKDNIREIEYKIDKFNQRVKDQILEISEEIYVVEKISKLNRKKQKRIELLSDIEKKLYSSDYYQILRKIKLLEMRLKEIYKYLNKWSNKRKNCHKKMLDLYREARVFRSYKKKMENRLRENKNTADHYYQQFLKVMNQNGKIIIEEKLYKSNEKPQQIKKISPRRESIIEKKNLYKNYIQDKLAIALEKQKAGKKLHISEYKLILKHSKNNF